MIGFLRLALALLVVQTHLGAGHYGGRFAVIGFYILAGYFATFGMCNQYRGQPIKFLKSRAARIFPCYWVVWMISIAWLHFYPDTPWGDVMQLGTWLEPLGVAIPRLAAVPTAWTITVMLSWWAAIALGIASTAERAAVWLFASALFVAAAGAWPLSDWYTSVWFGSFWFALGAFGYHAGLKLPRDKGLSATAGAMSYPIFLCHMLIGAMVGHWLAIGRGWPLFFVALPPTLALSWLLVVAVERPISNFRKPLRR